MNLFEREIRLENDRAKLVPFDAVYKDGLRQIIYDEEITRFGGGLPFRTEHDLERYIEDTCKSRTNGQSYPFIVIDKHTGEVAGSTRFGYIVPHNKRLEIGWTWYGQAYRGTGLNKACKYELLKFVFEEMGYRRVQLSVDIDNIRSQRAVLKLGATQEGIFRSNYIGADGSSRDDVYFSIIHTEWDRIKREIFPEYA
jgi:RimJ/RimL family protein N-acetyltransferase